jgi:hypothetical protein
MVHIPRHRRRAGTPRTSSRTPYDDPYDPHHHLSRPPTSRSSQWILLLAGMGIGYLILPVLLVQNNQQIRLEEVVQRLEERQRASQNPVSFNYASQQHSSPMNMMQSHRDGAATLLRNQEHNGNVVGSDDSRRRTAGPELKSAVDGGGSSLRGDLDRHSEEVDRHQQEDVEVEKTVEMPEKGDDDESDDEAEEEEPVQKSDIQSKPIGLPNSKQNAKEQLSQILTADKQSTELEENDLTDAQRRFVETQKLIASQSIPTSTTPHVMKTPNLPDAKRKKVLVTGGAGFVGSHLVDKLMMEGHEVIVLDNFFTGQRKNIEHWMHHPHFSLVVHDVTEPIMLEVDEIYHLACPASPPHYQYNPVKTIKTSTMGTINMLGLAKRVKAKILLTSTSEVSELCCCFVLWFV